MKVVIMESLGISQEELDARKAPFEAEGVTFETFARTEDKAKLVEEAKDADVMIIANMPMPSEVIGQCEKLRYIDVAFTGVDHVGLDAAKAHGITVSNASGYSNEAVAELAVSMALSLSRNLRAVEDRARTGGTKDGLVGTEIRGRKVGIIGLGHIGSRSAELFHAFGAEILTYNRTIHKDAPDYVKQVTLDELLAQSDIVALHCPLTDSTRGMINAQRLSQMKPSAMLLNLSRGPVVVSADLAQALTDGVIAAAGIDVFDKEPPLNDAEPLLHAPHTLLTPHVAFATKESMTLRAQIVFDNLRAWMDAAPKNVVFSP